MPTIRVEMLEGRSDAQKSSFVEAVTKAAVEQLGSPLEHVDVVLTEVSRSHWATGGVLWRDVKPKSGTTG